MKKLTLKEFGERLRKIRLKLGLSQNRASHLAFLNGTQLRMIEEGKRDPRLTTIVNISIGWNVPLYELCQPPNPKTSERRAGIKTRNGK